MVVPSVRKHFQNINHVNVSLNQQNVMNIVCLTNVYIKEVGKSVFNVEKTISVRIKYFCMLV